MAEQIADEEIDFPGSASVGRIIKAVTKNIYIKTKHSTTYHQPETYTLKSSYSTDSAKPKCTCRKEKFISCIVPRPFRNIFNNQTPPPWDDADEYNFSQPRRGLMIIINNEYFIKHSARPGSSKDAAGLQYVYAKLGFDVQLYHNQTRDQMMSILKKAAKSDHGNADCFSCAILSHGDQVQLVEKGKKGQYERADIIYATDKTMYTSEIVQMFNDKKCPTLQGKPRFFFIQACRGDKLDSGAELLVSGVDETDAVPLHMIEVSPCPIYKDCLIMYATPPGHYAFRRPDSGSWFVNGLCEVLNRPDAGNQSLTKLLTLVIKLVSQEFESRSANQKITKKKQTPCFSSMLVKDVFFRSKERNVEMRASEGDMGTNVCG